MDLSDLRKLVRLMEKAELSELEIDDSKEGVRIHLKRILGPDPSAVGGVPPSLLQVLSPASQVPAAGGLQAGAPGGLPQPEPAERGEVIKSPMVGTFYRSPSPDADPFVSAGTRFGEDTVLCIIEAMKVMNEIRAELEGEILEVLVENGEPVEFGQPLFLIKKS